MAPSQLEVLPRDALPCSGGPGPAGCRWYPSTSPFQPCLFPQQPLEAEEGLSPGVGTEAGRAAGLRQGPNAEQGFGVPGCSHCLGWVSGCRDVNTALG